MVPSQNLLAVGYFCIFDPELQGHHRFRNVFIVDVVFALPRERLRSRYFTGTYIHFNDVVCSLFLLLARELTAFPLVGSVGAIFVAVTLPFERNAFSVVHASKLVRLAGHWSICEIVEILLFVRPYPEN